MRSRPRVVRESLYPKIVSYKRVTWQACFGRIHFFSLSSHTICFTSKECMDIVCRNSHSAWYIFPAFHVLLLIKAASYTWLSSMWKAAGVVKCTLNWSARPIPNPFAASVIIVEPRYLTRCLIHIRRDYRIQWRNQFVELNSQKTWPVDQCLSVD